MPPTEHATRILARLADGDAAASGELMALVYEELRALAGGCFRNQPADHTLQPTALAHEAFIRLVDQTSIRFNDRAHFFAVAATAMRQILTDHARRARAEKRGGGRRQVSLEGVDAPGAARGSEGERAGGIDLIALDEALTKLAALDPRQHRLVELRFFGGLSMEEIAGMLGVSKATVELDWRAARAWLNVQLGGA